MKSFISFLKISVPFIYFSCLIALAWTSDNSDEKRYLCLVTNLREKSVLSLTIRYDVSCGIFVYTFFFF